MADEVKVKVTLATEKAIQALNKFEKSLLNLSAKIDKSLGSSVDKTTQKMKTLGDKSSKSLDKVGNKATQASKGIEKVSKTSNKAAQKIKRLKERSKKAADEMSRVKKESLKAEKALNKIAKASAKAAKEAERLANKEAAALKKIGRAYEKAAKKSAKLAEKSKKANKATKGLTSQFAIGTVIGNVYFKALSVMTAGLSNAVRETVEFEKRIREINTILPNNAKLTKKTSEELRALARNFGSDPSQQAKSFYQIISAGITDTSDALVVLEAANSLALGGLADLETTITGVTKIMSVYGGELESAEEISDVLFATVRVGQTRIEDLASALPDVLSISSAVGVSFKDMAGAVATLTTRAGSTAQAVTQLRGIFTALAKNQERAKKILGKNADAFSIAALKAKGLTKFLVDLKAAAGDTETLSKLLGRVEALNGVLNLGADGFVKLQKSIHDTNNAAGESAKALEEVKKSFDTQFKIMKSNVTDLAVEIGNKLLPAVTSAIKGVNKLFKGEPTLRTTGSVKALRRTIAALTEDLDKIKSGEERDLLNFGDEERVTSLLKQALKKLNEINSLTSQPMQLQFEFDPASQDAVDFILNGSKGKLDPIAVPIMLQGAPDSGLDPEELKSDLTPDKNKVDKVTAEQQAILAARKQGAIELQAFEEELKITEEEAAITELIGQQQADEMDLQRLRDLELEKINIKFEAEAAKAKLTKDSELRKIKLAQVDAKREIALEKATAKQEGDILKARRDLNEKISKNNSDIAFAGANLAATIAKDGSKLQFVIQKSSAIAASIVATNVAAAKALASAPYPANLGLAAQVKTIGALNTASIIATTIKGFKDGGIVGGNSFTGDRVLARVNSGEAILNQSQQRNLLDIANGGGSGGDSSRSIEKLAESIDSIGLSITIGNDTVAKSVREARKEGFEI